MTPAIRLGAVSFGFALLLLAGGSELFLALTNASLTANHRHYNRLTILAEPHNNSPERVREFRKRLVVNDRVGQVAYLKGPVTNEAFGRAVYALRLPEGHLYASRWPPGPAPAGVPDYNMFGDRDLLLVVWDSANLMVPDQDEAILLGQQAIDPVMPDVQDLSVVDSSMAAVDDPNQIANAAVVDNLLDRTGSPASSQLNLAVVRILMLVTLMVGVLGIFLGGSKAQLRLAVMAVPRNRRQRYLEEWSAELATMKDRSRLARSRWLSSLLLIAIPKMAVTLRLPAWLGS